MKEKELEKMIKNLKKLIINQLKNQRLLELQKLNILNLIMMKC